MSLGSISSSVNAVPFFPRPLPVDGPFQSKEEVSQNIKILESVFYDAQEYDVKLKVFLERLTLMPEGRSECVKEILFQVSYDTYFQSLQHRLLAFVMGKDQGENPVFNEQERYELVMCYITAQRSCYRMNYLPDVAYDFLKNLAHQGESFLKIAQELLALDPVWFIINFHRFIEDENLRVSVVKMIVQKAANNTHVKYILLENFELCHIQNQEEIYNILKSFEVPIGKIFFEHRERFRITDKEVLCKIFKHIGQQISKKICENIHDFQFSDEQILELIEVLNLDDVLNFFGNFHFKDMEKILQAAFLILQKIKKLPTYFIKQTLEKFIKNIVSLLKFDHSTEEEPKKLFELVQACMDTERSTTCKFMQDFNIRNENFKLNLFELGLDHGSANHIAQFQFSDATLLKLALTIPPKDVAANFPAFNIKNPDDHKRVVQRLVESKDNGWIEHFNLLGIEDPDERFRLALLAVDRREFGFAVSHFKIESEERRKELFKKHQQGYETRWLYYRNFQIEDDAFFSSIITETQKQSRVSIHDMLIFPIKNYRTLNREFYFDFAKKVAHNTADIFKNPLTCYSALIREVYTIWIREGRGKEIAPATMLQIRAALQKNPMLTFERYLNLIEERRDPSLAKDIVQLIATCDMLGFTPEERAKYQHHMDLIVQYRQQGLRLGLIRDLIKHMVEDIDPTQTKERAEVRKAVGDTFKGQKKEMPLFEIVLNNFRGVKLGADFLEVMKNMTERRIKKDSIFQRIIVKPLQKLSEVSEYVMKDEEKWDILVMIFKQKTTEEVIDSLKTLEAILDFKTASKLSGPKTIQKLNKALMESFQEITGIENIPNFEVLFLRNIYTERSGNALCRLGAAINDCLLSGPEKVSVQSLFKTMTEILLTGSKEKFKELRYQLTNKHSEIFFRNQEFAQKWVQGARQEVNFAPEDEVQLLSPKDRVATLHRNISDPNHYKVDGKMITKDSFENIYKLVTSSESVESRVKQLHGLRLEENQEALFEILIRLTDPELSALDAATLISRKLDKLKMALPVDPFGQYLTDLNTIMESSTSAPKFKGGTLTFVDTDDPEDLLLCGTEVQGSCLSLDTGSNSRCVLANMLDSKIRMVAVKDAQGHILARRMLKVLVNRRTGEKVLLRERLYKAPGISDNVIKEFDKFVVDRARDLQCVLVSAELEGSTSLGEYRDVVESLGSVVPLEYSDAAHQMSGVYTLINLYLLAKRTN